VALLSREVDIPPEVRALAEDPFANCPDPPAELGFARFIDDRLVVHSSPTPTLQLVERLRLRPEEVGDAVVAAREFLTARGMHHAFWMISDSTMPEDLEEHLRALGMRTNDQPPLEAEQVAMALVRPPATERPRDIQAGPVRTVDEALAAVDVMSDVFGMPREQRAPMYDLSRRSFEYAQRPAAEPVGRTYVARLDGEIVGTARALLAYAGVNLVGGAVIERARGRGVYRALVWARWDDACARGTPALTVQAGKMSLPILERLGFVRVARAKVLLDQF